MNSIPGYLLNDQNREVLAYLEGKSCHSDIVEPINQVIRHYPEVHSYCADRVNFSYTCWYKDQTIIAFAIGMGNVYFRLPNMANLPDVLTDAPKAGPHWYAVDWQSPYLEILLRAALNA